MDFGNEEKEEEEKPELAQGVLAQLLLLERRDRCRALRDERRERLRERRELLQTRIRELRQRRERLREKLRAPAGIPSDPRAVLSWKLRELRRRLGLFPLTGISGMLCRGGASFSFHPSFEGSFLRPFHLELLEKREFRPENRERRPENREWHLGRHSIPAFIPLERLRREFLPGRLRLFLGILFRHLNAFVARREQLRRAQEEFPDCIQGIPCSNSLCNLLSFRYRIPRKKTGIPGKKPKIPGENSKIPGENSEISRKNSEISRKIGKIPRENAEISGENSQIPEENEEFSGENEEFSGIPGKNPSEFWVRLRYGDPLRSLPTDVEISAHAPPEHRELFRSLSLPGALGALAAADSRKIPEFPTGNG